MGYNRRVILIEQPPYFKNFMVNHRSSRIEINPKIFKVNSGTVNPVFGIIMFPTFITIYADYRICSPRSTPLHPIASSNKFHTTLREKLFKRKNLLYFFQRRWNELAIFDESRLRKITFLKNLIKHPPIKHRIPPNNFVFKVTYACCSIFIQTSKYSLD